MNKKDKEWHDKMLDLNRKNSLKNQIEENRTRARSFNVGTCFGGVTEISMRGNNSSYLWCPLQPVEVIELINQLAANIGCHIQIVPRQDFASWREWKEDTVKKVPYKPVGSSFTERENYILTAAGWPPFPNDMWDGNHDKVGAILPSPDEQAGLKKIDDGVKVGKSVTKKQKLK